MKREMLHVNTDVKWQFDGQLQARTVTNRSSIRLKSLSTPVPM